MSGAAVRVRVAVRQDEPAWNAYVDAHLQATVFHRFTWCEVLAESLGYTPQYLIATGANGGVSGVLPLMLVRSRLYGTTLVSLPFCAYGGPLVDDRETLHALDEYAQVRARTCAARYVEYRFPGATPLQAPVQDLYQTFTRAVPENIEELAAVPQKRRSLLRKAQRLGLRAEIGRDVETFFELYADNAHAHGTPALPKRFFHVLLDHLGDSADILLVRDAQGQALSGMLNYHFRDRLMAYFAGETDGARASYANDFKCWQLLVHARRSGHAVLDYGRSKIGTGSMDFKKLWGFEATPLHYAFRLLGASEIPQNNPMNPKYRLAIGLWQKLPRPIVDFVGPRVIHGLG